MADLDEFKQKQYAFAAHIRNPADVDAPSGIEDRRMAIYRELFFNNLHKLLSNTFPVLRKIHSTERWRELTRLFMIHHESQTPYFLQIPKEFIAFIEKGYPGSEQDYPFLLELAHYEYVELELSVSTAQNDLSAVDRDGDLITGVPVKSVVASVLSYQFPVHNISADFLPEQPGEQPTYLAVFRTEDDELSFMELNPVTARLLQIIEENTESQTGEQLLRQLAGEMNYADVDTLIAHGGAAMEQMRQAGILIGTEKN